MTDDHDSSKISPEEWEDRKRALLNTRRRPAPEFAAFLDTLDALDFDIAVYLAVELKVGFELVPKLVPLIDRRCFEDRLRLQINDILKKLTDEQD